MSADEIRMLAADALSNGIKIHDELLKHAAMVERCEELHSGAYGISDDDYNYIMKGATDERK